jgi:hypothetical protein
VVEVVDDDVEVVVDAGDPVTTNVTVKTPGGAVVEVDDDVVVDDVEDVEEVVVDAAHDGGAEDVLDVDGGVPAMKTTDVVPALTAW